MIDTLEIVVTPDITRRDVVQIAVQEGGIMLASFTHVLRFGHFPNHHLQEFGVVTYPLCDLNFSDHTRDILKPQFKIIRPYTRQSC